MLDTLGEYVDAPPYRGGEPSLGNIVTRLTLWLAGLPPRERYDRIKAWSLPTANRSSVRLLATYVPEDAPPAVFGNFKSTTFDGGMASTAAMLIDSARAVDALDDLARQAAELDRTKVENADTLLVLTQIAREQSGLAKARIRERTAKIKAMTTGPIPWSDQILVRACLNDTELERDPGEAYARALIGLGQKTQSWRLLSHLRRDLGLSIARRAGSEAVRPGGDAGLDVWHPAAVFDADQHAAGAVPAWWVETEGHVQQVTGPEDQQLLLDYPLTGRFTFAADAWVGGWSESSLGYGGLVMERYARCSGQHHYGRTQRSAERAEPKFPAHLVQPDGGRSRARQGPLPGQRPSPLRGRRSEPDRPLARALRNLATHDDVPQLHADRYAGSAAHRGAGAGRPARGVGEPLLQRDSAPPPKPRSRRSEACCARLGLGPRRVRLDRPRRRTLQPATRLRRRAVPACRAGSITTGRSARPTR